MEHRTKRSTNHLSKNTAPNPELAQTTFQRGFKMPFPKNCNMSAAPTRPLSTSQAAETRRFFDEGPSMERRFEVALATDNDKAEQDEETVLESFEGTSYELAMAALELPLELMDNLL